MKFLIITWTCLQIKGRYYIVLCVRSSVLGAYDFTKKKKSQNLDLNIELGDSILGADLIDFITEQHYHESGISLFKWISK